MVAHWPDLIRNARFVTFCAPVAVVVVLIAAVLGLQAAAQAPGEKMPQDPAQLAGLLQACELPTYKPPPDTRIKNLVSNRRQYQLVIGASEYPHSPDLNRPFIHETARAVSARLEEMGYAALPSLEARKIKFLSGKDATKANVWNAIMEMARVATGSDVGVIYYIGHGSVTFSKRDLSLAVQDRAVVRDEGIRVSDIISTLSLQHYPSNVKEIPKFILILETCYSGNVISGTTTEIADKGGMRILAEVNKGIAPQPPPGMVMISATAEGDVARAFGLRGSPMSAFGFFFTRAFREDWACVDTTPDGILTVRELEGYLEKRLQAAHKAALIEGPMMPLVRDEQRFSFLAYDDTKYSTPGDHDRVVQLFIRSDPTQVATLTLPDGSVQTCPPACSASVSASSDGGVTIRTRSVMDIGVKPNPGSLDSLIDVGAAIDAAEKSERVMTIAVKELAATKGQLAVSDKVSIQVQ